jgi:hypothetical protein
MKRLVREQKRYLRRHADRARLQAGKVFLLASAFCLGMVAA